MKCAPLAALVVMAASFVPSAFVRPASARQVSGAPSAPAAPAAPAVPVGQAQPPAAQLGGRVFAAPGGMIFNPIKPDKAADFERVMGRVHEALERSEDPVRQQQAAGWRVLKAAEPGPNGSVLYVFTMDPAVKGADYTISRILSEAFPAEVQQLFALYNAAFAGAPSLLNLAVVENFADARKPRTDVVPGASAPTATPAAGAKKPQAAAPPAAPQAPAAGRRPARP